MSSIEIIFKAADYGEVFDPYVWSTGVAYDKVDYCIQIDGPRIPNQKRYQDADKEESLAEAKRILAAEALKIAP